jgi:hypothetical protein
MMLSDYLREVGECLLHNELPPEPETAAEYHAVIEQYPDQAWRWQASERAETLIVGDPVPWPRDHQRRLVETIKCDGAFRQELLSALGMESDAKQASGQRVY